MKIELKHIKEQLAIERKSHDVTISELTRTKEEKESIQKEYEKTYNLLLQGFLVKYHMNLKLAVEKGQHMETKRNCRALYMPLTSEMHNQHENNPKALKEILDSLHHA